jgi:hypothetical protein
MRVAVSGALAQRPFRGGHAWVFLQYLLGFERLGCEVLFVDRLEPEMCTDSQGRPCAANRSRNMRYVADVMAAFGLEDSYAVLVEGGTDSLGMDRRRLAARLRRSDMLLDVMGYLRCPDLVADVPLKVFLDVDPGFTQMWFALGLHDPFGDHDAYATVGGNIGRPECLIPSCDVAWVHTRPPVVLEQWPVRPSGSGRRMTSVCTWRGPFAPISYGGHDYGLRVHQLRQFASLPGEVTSHFELALDIDPWDEADLRLLMDGGWQIVDPAAVAADPASYRTYIEGSAAEFMIPKDMYRRSNSGWFSDRSACYLASGRPVLALDTGLDDLYPVGDGLITFKDPAEAPRAVERLWNEYGDHSDAARALAEEAFDSDRVLADLLTNLGS